MPSFPDTFTNVSLWRRTTRSIDSTLASSNSLAIVARVCGPCFTTPRIRSFSGRPAASVYRRDIDVGKFDAVAVELRADPTAECNRPLLFLRLK